MKKQGVCVQTYRRAYSTGSVDTSTWLEIDSSLNANASGVEIFDSCGQVMELGYGASSAEQRLMLVKPGGTDGHIVPAGLHAGMRVCYRGVSAASGTDGELVINFYK